MKTILTTLALLTGLSVFAAGNKAQGGNPDSTQIIQTVSEAVNEPGVLQALGVEGQADITLAVDTQGQVHVAQVVTGNYLLEYHIRQAVENLKLTVNDSLIGKTFSFIMNVVQSR